MGQDGETHVRWRISADVMEKVKESAAADDRTINYQANKILRVFFTLPEEARNDLLR